MVFADNTDKIEKYSDKLYYKLTSQFPKIKKTRLTYKINIDNKKQKCNVVNLVYYNEKDKLWFAKTQTNEDIVYLFGKYSDENNFKIYNPILHLNFNKKQLYQKSCSGLFYNDSSNLSIYMNMDYFKDNVDNYGAIIKDFKKTRLSVLDNQTHKNLEFLELGEVNQNFTTNLVKLINNLLKSKDEPNSNKNTCMLCNGELDKNNKLQGKFCNDCSEKILCFEFYNETRKLFNTSYMAISSLKREYNEEVLNYCFKLLEKYDLITYAGGKKYIYFNINDPIFQNESYAYHNLLDSLKNSYEDEDNLINAFIISLKQNKDPEEIAKTLNIPNSKIRRWCKQAKQGNQKYVEFYENYKKAKECEICKKPLNKYSKSKICKKCSKKAYSASILKLLLKHIDPLIPFKIKDFKAIGYPTTTIASYLKILKGNDLINKENDTYSLKDQEILDNFIKIYESYGNEITPQNHIRLSKRCSKCKKTLAISKFSKNQDMCIDCKKESISNDEKQIKTFIKMLNAGKKQSEIIESLNITKDMIESWCDKGKDKISPYKEFYEKYDVKYCKICGKTLRENTKKDICRNCSREIIIAKLLAEVLKSIDFESPFSDNDLEKLGYDKLKIKDFIWTLQENDLINTKNGKYRFKNEESIAKFLKKYGIEYTKTQTTSKECKICGKSLPKNEKEDYCKNCKKSIITAKALNELLENIDAGSTYSEDLLKKYYASEFDFNSKIWNMQDFDLITYDIDNKEYTITSEKTCDDFLDKYYAGKKATKKDDERIKELVILLLTNCESVEQAAKLIENGKYEKEIENWYNLGKQNNKQHVNFYNKCNELLKLDLLDENLPEGILKPLPSKYDEYFRLPGSKTCGFAWVKKSGNKWAYTRQNKKKRTRITDTTLIGLYHNVKNQNQIWGVRDLKKAKETLINKDDKSEKPRFKVEEINILSIETESRDLEVIIKGVIKNTELIKLLNYLKEFEKNIIKLISTQNNDNKFDIFIELNLKPGKFKALNEKINNLKEKTSLL